MSQSPSCLIVGAGVAGLTCARVLNRKGFAVSVLEASDEVGGRVRTDDVDGFRLDRGFQVLLEAYPEVRQEIDLATIPHGVFSSGSCIYDGKQTRLFADPLRHPRHGLSSALHPAGSLGDKLKLARLRHQLANLPLSELFAGEDMSTSDYWEHVGFSASMQKQFLAPFFRGIYLADETEVSARMFRFIFSMFGQGRAVLPNKGIGEIPKQLAASLPPDCVKLNQAVARVEAGSVTLASGETLRADHVVLANGDPSLLGFGSTDTRWHATTCVYFAADKAPVPGPWLILNGSGSGQVNQVAVLSQVAAEVAPEGRECISVSINGDSDVDDETLAEQVKNELHGWFGAAVKDWSPLRTYRVKKALPAFGSHTLPGPGFRKDQGVWICGDLEQHPSLQGAMNSGRLVADDLIGQASP